MKRYLLAGLVVLCVGAEASENPFDLRKNLQALDSDQKTLLTELQQSVKSDEMLDDGEIQEDKPAQSDEKAAKAISVQPTVPEAAVPVQETASEQEAAPAKTPEATAVDEEEKLNETMIEAQKKAEIKRKEELQAAQLAAQKQEEERLRLEEEVKKKTQIKAQEEKTRQKEQEKQEVQEKGEVLKAAIQVTDTKSEAPVPMQEEKPKTEIEASKSSEAADKGNMTQEEVDKLYLEAIKEVDAK